jgi:transposase
LAPGKKNARRLKAWLCFVDESGFSQRPPIRATWAPRGETPCLVEPFNWERVSGIGALLASADGRRTRWLLALHGGGIGSAHVVRFLEGLRRHRRRPVILLWDGLPAHRSRLTAQALARHRRWLHLEPLPAYAPELNPVEQLWAHLDATALANTPADDLDRLRARVRRGLNRVHHHPHLGRAFLRHAGLF